MKYLLIKVFLLAGGFKSQGLKPPRSMDRENFIIVNGKRYVRSARLPKGAFPQKPLEEILAVYGYGKANKDRQDRNTTAPRKDSKKTSDNGTV